jgi:DNA primase
VATCGTALTEDHVRLLRRYARRIVLAFDADAAGQGAAERVYQWERTHDVAVSVAHLPDGMDPADLARRDPASLAAAVEQAEPFLGFRLHRVLRAARGASPEQRARTASDALAVVAEHPDLNVRTLYAGEIAAATGLPMADVVASAKRASTAVKPPPRAPSTAPRATGEVAALWLLLHRWDDIAPWLAEPLFADELCLRTFRALAAGEGDFSRSLASADPDVAEQLERLAVTEMELDADLEARNLIASAVRRELDHLRALRDVAVAGRVAEAKLLLERLGDPEVGADHAERLLRWLDDGEER